MDTVTTTEQTTTTVIKETTTNVTTTIGTSATLNNEYLEGIYTNGVETNFAIYLLIVILLAHGIYNFFGSLFNGS